MFSSIIQAGSADIKTVFFLNGFTDPAVLEFTFISFILFHNIIFHNVPLNQMVKQHYRIIEGILLHPHKHPVRVPCNRNFLLHEQADRQV